MAKFAEGTRVTVESSRKDIETQLKRFGATKFVTSIDDDSGRAMVQFFARGRWVRLTLELKRPNPKGRKVRVTDAEERRLWRSLAALVKAKMIAVDDGLVEFEEEFLPHVLMANGETVYERSHQAIAAEYQTGAERALLEGPR